MAKERVLDYVLLGLLSHEDLTGYEIKKRIDSGLSFFWGASYGSIYPALSDLVQRGLAVRTEESGGPREKIHYHITSSGRDHLKNWLLIPAKKDEFRSETLLKVFFGGESSPEAVLAQLDAFEERTAVALQQLREYEKVLQSITGEDDDHRYFLATVRFGISTYQAWLDWADELRA